MNPTHDYHDKADQLLDQNSECFANWLNWFIKSPYDAVKAAPDAFLTESTVNMLVHEYAFYKTGMSSTENCWRNVGDVIDLLPTKSLSERNILCILNSENPDIGCVTAYNKSKKLKQLVTIDIAVKVFDKWVDNTLAGRNTQGVFPRSLINETLLERIEPEHMYAAVSILPRKLICDNIYRKAFAAYPTCYAHFPDSMKDDTLAQDALDRAVSANLPIRDFKILLKTILQPDDIPIDTYLRIIELHPDLIHPIQKITNVIPDAEIIKAAGRCKNDIELYSAIKFMPKDELLKTIRNNAI